VHYAQNQSQNEEFIKPFVHMRSVVMPGASSLESREFREFQVGGLESGSEDQDINKRPSDQCSLLFQAEAKGISLP